MKTFNVNGIQCVDATEPLTFTVTKNDVALASRKDHPNCAIARSLMKQTGRDVLVSRSRVYVKQTYQDVWVRYISKNSLREQLISFDQGGTFSNGEYSLNPAQPCKKLGQHTGGQKKVSSPKRRSKPVKLTGVRRHAGNWPIAV
tara:strand:+ start:1432 stop:1863 length:432 start_codon:yes stop_codon:yes gene_type:complete